MIHRRDFIKRSSSISVTALLPLSIVPSFEASSRQDDILSGTDQQVIRPDDEDHWAKIRSQYELPSDFIDLENAWYNVISKKVLGSQINHISRINALGTRYIRKEHDQRKAQIKDKLAQFLGVNSDEIALLRNATEGLNAVIMGYPFSEGDEAIIAQQDYFTMIEAFQQRSNRSKVVLKSISQPFQSMSDKEIVKAYEDLITDKTKLILVTQLINTTGQILPLKEIATMAHQNNVEVVVDAAQSLGQIPIHIPDLNTDYFSASLHKWIGAPLAMGVLHIPKKNIEKVWPLIGITNTYPNTDIRKFEYVGTNAIANEATIEDALKFHQTIGTANISNRLAYLKNYWVEQVKDLEKVVINTPLEEHRSCAIANFHIKGWDPVELEKALWERFQIYVMRINYQGVNGIRVTPQVYNSTKELDKLVLAIKSLSS